MAAKPWLVESALFLPNLARLIASLMKDDRVPGRTKATLAGIALYLASPVDIIPDFIPLVGYLDDLVVAAVVLDGLLNFMDRKLIEEHWKGRPETLTKASRIASVIARLVPRRIKERIFAPGA